MLNLENTGESRKSKQALGVPSEFKNRLFTDKVITRLLNSLRTPMSYSRPTVFSSLKFRYKRGLFLFHRWAGITLCLFFAAWFLSGIFMMYVEFPRLDQNERLAGSPTLDFSRAQLSPAQAVAVLRQADFSVEGTPRANQINAPEDPAAPLTTPSAVRLGMLLDRPVYHISAGRAQPRTVFADNGEVLSHVSPSFAADVAADFAARAQWLASADPAPLSFLGTVQTDQWTLSAALNAHRPLLHFSLNDQYGTELYVSSSSGEVVRDSQALERALNYFGAVTHWLYPTFVRRYPQLWRWLVEILSGVGVILALSGLWIGILRWKRNPRPGKPSVPYRGLMRWHYFTGAIFGVVTVTWVFSGLLSMNPAGLNPSRVPSPDQQAVITGVDQPLRIRDFTHVLNFFGADAVEANLMHRHGEALYLVTHRDGSRTQLSTQGHSAAPARLDHLQALAPQLLPTASVDRMQLLTRYDNYYYSRHPERGGRPLPVLRVTFDDSANTWFHIDAITGSLIERSTTTNRVYRWLYNGLHSWDILWLWERRPLWDIAVISFSLGGFFLSMLGVMVGWRRLRYGLRTKHQRAARAKVTGAKLGEKGLAPPHEEAT